MSKYIDADKLIAEIERLYDIAREASYNGEIEGKMTAYDKILSIITSLQQEQQEQLPGIEDPGIPGKDFIPVEWVDACEMYGKWKIIKLQQPSLPSNLDEAAKEYMRNYIPFDQCDSRDIVRTFKAGAEWMAEQFQKIEGELVDWYSSPEGKDYCCGFKTQDAFEVPEGFYIRKKKL